MQESDFEVKVKDLECSYNCKSICLLKTLIGFTGNCYDGNCCYDDNCRSKVWFSTIPAQVPDL